MKKWCLLLFLLSACSGKDNAARICMNASDPYVPVIPTFCDTDKECASLGWKCLPLAEAKP